MALSRLSAFGLAVLLLAAVRPQASPASGGSPEQHFRLRAEAESLWLRRGEPASMRNALAIYERLAALEPELATAHIRLARAFWWYAMLRPGADRNERRDLFRRGASAARRAQQLVPLDPGGYFWEAANRVHASTIEGGLVPPDEILRIRKLVRKVHHLNTWYHHGSIRYVEAELILKLPTLQRWLIARNLQSGIDLALGALGFENNCFYGHWVLARGLAAAGRRSAAIAQLDFILGANPESFLPDAPENRAVKRWALVLREELAPGD